jgi:3-dehydroquinate dehydratase-2
MPSILLINGPNLNLLGLREPQIYGSATLQDVENTCRDLAAKDGVQLESFQSNHEGHLIDRIHEARNKVDVIIINPAGFTHTSVALRDALLGVAIPFIEVHISNIHTRESWRHHSYFSDKAAACIIGLGTFGYEAAVQHAVRNLISKRSQSSL